MSEKENGAKQKSSVWLYFEKNSTNKTVICKICKKQYKDFGNTTNLITHMRGKHSLQFSGFFENKDKSIDRDSKINNSCGLSTSTANNQVETVGSDTTRPEECATKKRRYKQLCFSSSKKQTQKDIDIALVKMICTDIQPLQIVENKGFINFVRTLHADYILPDRKTLSERYLPQQYQLARSSLADKLEDVKNLALTTDMWTSDSNKSYLTVTVHFISESKLFARTLSTVEVKDVHSATVIANVLDTVLEEWRISDKVVTVVTDNASNIKKAVSEYLNKRNHFCVAHTLNLAVSDCKKSNLPLTSLLEKCHTIVTYFKQSTKAAYKLKELQEQMNHPVIKLKQEVITRWNSSFEMMERLLQTKLSLSAALSTMSSAPENFTANQWEAIEDCVSVLKPIEQLTTILSGEKYPTLSSMIPLIRNVQTCLIKKVPVTEIGENLKISLHSAITKRLGILETNKTAAKSTFLDPRYKKAGFGLEANAEKAAQWVLEELESEIIKKNRNLAPDESSQTVNTSSNANASIGTNNKANDLWEDFDKKISERELIQTPTSSAIVIVKQYREMQYLDRHLEPILFWEQRKKAMPELYELAIKYLCIPASSVPAERVFSKAALICNQRRNRLDSKKVDEIIFLNSYFS